MLTGLLVIVPGVITVWVLHWIVGTLDQTLAILPEAWHPDRLLGMHIPGFGVLLTLAILLSVGAVASNFVGRKLVSWGDAVISRIPVVRRFIPASNRCQTRFSPTAATPFALLCWCSGRAKGSGRWLLSPAAPPSKWPAICGMDYVSVFVPTTPNPTGGYFVLMRKSDCVELEMSVDARAQVHRLHGGGGAACHAPAWTIETINIFYNRVP